MLRLAFMGLCLLPLGLAWAQSGEGPLKEFAPSLSIGLKGRLEKANVSAGADYFERKCSPCHDAAKDGSHSKGPHLWAVMGRKAGSAPGFEYSLAMHKVGCTWDYATLDYYLTDPYQAVPGVAMNFSGIRNDQQRANVVAYLRTLADTPVPLP